MTSSVNCRVLTKHGTPIAPSTFYDARDRTSARLERDEQLKAEVIRVHKADYGVYGAPQGLTTAQPARQAGSALHRRAAEARARSRGCPSRSPAPHHDRRSGRAAGR